MKTIPVPADVLAALVEVALWSDYELPLKAEEWVWRNKRKIDEAAPDVSVERVSKFTD